MAGIHRLDEAEEKEEGEAVSKPRKPVPVWATMEIVFDVVAFWRATEVREGDANAWLVFPDPTKPKKPATCDWLDDEDGVWHTDCGNAFEFRADGPVENRFIVCPYCSGNLTLRDEPVKKRKKKSK
jgi:hypothetical protein